MIAETTSVLVSNLPYPIRLLALTREKENLRALTHSKEKTTIDEIFIWELTPEGKDFWQEINKKNFKVYSIKYPYHEWLNGLE